MSFAACVTCQYSHAASAKDEQDAAQCCPSNSKCAPASRIQTPDELASYTFAQTDGHRLTFSQVCARQRVIMHHPESSDAIPHPHTSLTTALSLRCDSLISTPTLRHTTPARSTGVGVSAGGNRDGGGNFSASREALSRPPYQNQPYSDMFCGVKPSMDDGTHARDLTFVSSLPGPAIS